MTEFKAFVAKLEALQVSLTQDPSSVTAVNVADIEGSGALGSAAAKYALRLALPPEQNVYGEEMKMRVSAALSLFQTLQQRVKLLWGVKETFEISVRGLVACEQQEREQAMQVEETIWYSERGVFEEQHTALVKARADAKAAKHREKKKAYRGRQREREREARQEERAEEVERQAVGSRMKFQMLLGQLESREADDRDEMDEEEDTAFFDCILDPLQELWRREEEANSAIRASSPESLLRQRRVLLCDVDMEETRVLHDAPPRVILNERVALWAVWKQHLPLSQQKKAESPPMVIVLLTHGGSFAGVVTTDYGRAILAHKTLHRYVCRKGQGGRQSKHDGRTDTVGSQMRAHHEAAFREDVRRILTEWTVHLQTAAVIATHCPGPENEQIFFFKGGPLSRKNACVCGVPFTTHKPTMEEAMRVVKLMCTAEIL